MVALAGVRRHLKLGDLATFKTEGVNDFETTLVRI